MGNQYKKQTHFYYKKINKINKNFNNFTAMFYLEAQSRDYSCRRNTGQYDINAEKELHSMKEERVKTVARDALSQRENCLLSLFLLISAKNRPYK